MQLSIFKRVDWFILLFIAPILGAGLITMRSFVGSDIFFQKQILWIAIALIVYIAFTFIDARFLKRTNILVILFLASCFLLFTLFVLGHVSNGARSWFTLGGFSFQPSDPIQLIVILMLAKYFSRRHVEIADFKHILVSGVYAFLPFLLVFLQPDFGSAFIIFIIWLGMILTSGISRRHILVVGCIVFLAFGSLWVFAFHSYQKERIVNFIHPYTDVRGSGYNAYQSTIAVGSGELVGKGIGLGTQSRLRFLPEYQTDFIFSAFTEEWGFIGALLLLLLFSLVIGRILQTAQYGASNFEMLYSVGVAIFLVSHIIINVGMNVGLLPVTGITLPFMSYGGSHLITEFAALGILANIRSYRRAAHRNDMKNEFLGI